jgi:hypothetical protein
MVTTAFGSHWIFVSFGKLSRSSMHSRHGETKEDARGKERTVVVWSLSGSFRLTLVSQHTIHSTLSDCIYTFRHDLASLSNRLV